MSLRPSERTELRRSGFKASVDAGEAWRRRVDITVGVRKRGRGSALEKRRGAPAGSEAAQQPPLAIDKELAQRLYSDDSRMQLKAAREFRDLLSTENPPIDEVIGSGVVPRFLQLLAREDCPDLQFEVAWVLINITSGTPEVNKVVVDHGAVPVFVKLLRSPNEDVCEQAVWALGNMAGNAAICRDLVFSHSALFPLLELLHRPAKLSLLRRATWALSYFCHDWSQPNFDHVRPALPVLQQLILSQDEEILSNACLALFYLTDGNVDKIQAVIEAGVCPRLVELLTHSSPSVINAALRVIGNIARGNYAHIQCIIDHQVLSHLLNLLRTNQKKSINDVVCWTISNITAGNKEQIQDVINGNIIGPLVHLMQTAEFDVRKESAWATFNITSGGTPDQIKYLVSQGCIEAFCCLLSYADITMLMICLLGLENILKVGEAEESLGVCDVKMYTQMIDAVDGLDKIENLQFHDNNMISEMADRLLKSYWSRGK